MLASQFPLTSALTDFVVGDMLFFPPIFKSVLLGFFFWLIIHPLIRHRIYSGQVWHPTLLDLSLFFICVSSALALLG